MKVPKNKDVITQLDTLAKIRKQLPKPTRAFKNKKLIKKNKIDIDLVDDG